MRRKEPWALSDLCYTRTDKRQHSAPSFRRNIFSVDASLSLLSLSADKPFMCQQFQWGSWGFLWRECPTRTTTNRSLPPWPFFTYTSLSWTLPAAQAPTQNSCVESLRTCHDLEESNSRIMKSKLIALICFSLQAPLSLPGSEVSETHRGAPIIQENVSLSLLIFRRRKSFLNPSLSWWICITVSSENF